MAGQTSFVGPLSVSGAGWNWRRLHWRRQRSVSIQSSNLGASPLSLVPCFRRVSVLTMSISSNNFRTGTTIEIDGVVHRVIEFMHVKPGKGAAFVRTKLRNMKTGNTIDKTFRAGESVRSAELEKIQMQHTYVDKDEYVFMNMDTYDEERLMKNVLGEQRAKFLKIGMNVEALKHNDDLLGIEIPRTASYTVVETYPGAKGNTAQGSGTKPAILETGAEILVPLFINEGDQIKVNTEEAKYVSREKA